MLRQSGLVRVAVRIFYCVIVFTIKKYLHIIILDAYK